MTARERRESRFSRGGSNLRGASLALTMWKRLESTARRELGAQVCPSSGRDAASIGTLNKWRAERGAGILLVDEKPGSGLYRLFRGRVFAAAFFPGGGVVFRRTL